MSFASRIHERLRSRLRRMVEKERSRIGCATRAARNVAKMVFMSPATLYRTLNNYGEVKLSAVTQAAIIMHSVGIMKAASRFRERAKSPRASRILSAENRTVAG